MLVQSVHAVSNFAIRQFYENSVGRTPINTMVMDYSTGPFDTDREVLPTVTGPSTRAEVGNPT